MSAVYLGERVQYVVKLGTAQVRAAGPATAPLSKGTPVQVQIPDGRDPRVAGRARSPAGA